MRKLLNSVGVLSVIIASKRFDTKEPDSLRHLFSSLEKGDSHLHHLVG